jgi:hypothetical protein
MSTKKTVKVIGAGLSAAFDLHRAGWTGHRTRDTRSCGRACAPHSQILRGPGCEGGGEFIQADRPGGLALIPGFMEGAVESRQRAARWVSGAA